MIFKYNEFLNEKLTDNLSGFDENELKQRLVNNEIDIVKYLDICDRYHLKFPTDEEIKQYLIDNRNNNINIHILLQSLIEYKLKLPAENIIKPYVLNGNLKINDYIEYYNSLTPDEMYQALSNYKQNLFDVYNDMLIYASEYNFLDLFKKSFKFKVDIYALNVALFNAIENSNFEMVKYLVDYGVNVNSYNALNSMLYYAIIKKNYDIVNCLLENDAKIYYSDLLLDTTDEIKELLKKYYKP